MYEPFTGLITSNSIVTARGRLWMVVFFGTIVPSCSLFRNPGSRRTAIEKRALLWWYTLSRTSNRKCRFICCWAFLLKILFFFWGPGTVHVTAKVDGFLGYGFLVRFTFYHGTSPLVELHSTLNLESNILNITCLAILLWSFCWDCFRWP